MNTYRVHVGDARSIPLDDGSVHCCCTSPPYWGLRDYGVDGQIGLEKTPQEYVDALVAVFREVRRVLRDDGTLWLNLGDSYASTGGHTDTACNDRRGAYNIGNRPEHKHREFRCRGGESLKPKDLVGIPWLVAFALRSDCWFLRSDIIWSKPCGMPESVKDRPTKAHEYIFLLTKSERYYFDQDSVREPNVTSSNLRNKSGESWTAGAIARSGRGTREWNNPLGRNIRSVWHIATEPCAEAHFAVMPRALARKCILAGCPRGGTVLDPFGGSGTVALEAIASGRNAVLVELKPAYAELARRRLREEAPLLSQEVA